LTAASSPKPAIITCCSVVPPEKITRKASDVAENLQLQRIVRFFHLRSVYIYARCIYRRTFRQ